MENVAGEQGLAFQQLFPYKSSYFFGNSNYGKSLQGVWITEEGLFATDPLLIPWSNEIPGLCYHKISFFNARDLKRFAILIFSISSFHLHFQRKTF